MSITISIHALLAESDHTCKAQIDRDNEFQSTLSLRRATMDIVPMQVTYATFQSTLSLRRATSRAARRSSAATNFNPRSPCGERRRSSSRRRRSSDFNPRSPCGERPTSRPASTKAHRFQSTLSLRRATPVGRQHRPARSDFNPRSPCGERRRSVPRRSTPSNFNPRSPCGERLRLRAGCRR